VLGTTIRTEYSVSLAALGARVEEARTGILLNNRVLNNASGGWTETNVTAAASLVPDIFGGTDAFHLEATAGGASNIARTFTGTAAAYTLTARVHNDDCGWCVLSLNDGTTTRSKNFNIAAGTLGADGASAPTTSSIDDDGNGWYVCRITATMAVASCTAALHITDGDAASDPDAGEGLYADIPEVTLGAFATSPIVTAGSTVTRAADNISLATSAFPFSTTVGTIKSTVAAAGHTSEVFGLQLNNGTGNERIDIRAPSGGGGSGLGRMQVFAGGVSQCDITTAGTPTADQFYNMAGAFAANDFIFALDGTLSAADTSGAMPTGINTAQIGRRTTAQAACWVKNVFYVPRRMTNTELQALTA
jgi:hypothetical protein